MDTIIEILFSNLLMNSPILQEYTKKLSTLQKALLSTFSDEQKALFNDCEMKNADYNCEIFKYFYEKGIFDGIELAKISLSEKNNPVE